MISEVLDFFTMENYVDLIQIIVKLTYNGNTLTVMGGLHYLDVFFIFSENKSNRGIADNFSSFITSRTSLAGATNNCVFGLFTYYVSQF